MNEAENQVCPPLKPEISVVIANRNYAAYLGDAIDSVLAQTYPAHEIIVVDDGSTDNSADVLQHYGDQVKTFQRRHGGVSAARNHGISKARGQWIALLDSDDMWEPSLLATYVETMQAEPHAGLLAMGLRSVRADGSRTEKTHGRDEPRVEFTAASLLRGDAGLVITPLIRRDLLIKVGGFDEQLRSAEDCDLALRLSRLTRLVGINQPLILKREHSDSLSADQRLNARMWLRVLAKLARESPAFVAAHGHVYRRALGRDYLRLGREILNTYTTRRQLVAARWYLWQAIRTYPWRMRAMIYLAWAYLHPASYRRWRSKELRLKYPYRYTQPDRQ